MPNTSPNLVAGGNILPFRFVKVDTSADYQALQAGAGDAVIGVAYEGTNYAPLADQTVSVLAASAGQSFRIYGNDEICLVEAGGSFTAGQRVKSDVDGKAVAVAGVGNEHFGGLALETSTGAGQKVHIQVSTLRELVS